MDQPYDLIADPAEQYTRAADLDYQGQLDRLQSLFSEYNVSLQYWFGDFS